MNLLEQAIAWMFAPEQQTGRASIPNALLEHLGYTFASVLIAALIAVPFG